MGEIKKIYLGAVSVDKLLAGTDLIYEKNPVDATPPVTTVYPDSTKGPYSSGTKVWLEVNEACTTYYTLDGSTPTTASPIFREAFVFNEETTIKYFSIDLAGNIESVKTTTFPIESVGVTTISPTGTTQNTIPFTVTLSNSKGATIYYKVGAGVQQTYAGPFQVNQTTNNVGVNIPITYWSTGETEKTITYNTTGAIPGIAVPIATVGSWYVRLNWTATANTTSYNVYRSTVSGQLGELVSQYQAGTVYEDINAQNGTTYYYTVRSANYGQFKDSAPVTASPSAPVPKGWRYVRYIGHGDQTGVTDRLVEIQALEGSTNRLLNKLPLPGYTAPAGGTIALATDGSKLQATGYPFWWFGEGIPTLVYDLGAEYPIDLINVTGYSPAGDPRTKQFIIHVSKDNVNWTLVQDYSGNTTNQPTDGFYFTVPEA